jgi:cyclase
MTFSISVRRATAIGGAMLCACASHAQQNASELEMLPVQGNVYLLSGAGGNITVQIGNDGIAVVDSGGAATAAKLLPAIRKLSDKPIHWVINTAANADHIGGNADLAKAGPIGSGGGVLTDAGGTRLVAFQSVQDRLSAVPRGAKPLVPNQGLPNDTYFSPFKDFFFNDEAIVVTHLPAAHTDGDSIVFFRRSDVISTGDLFVPGRYPHIDLTRGGSVQGFIDALNRVLEITVPRRYQEGGTYVIPGHGRLCDEADVVEYRDMLTIVRDRVQSMLKQGLSLEQVKAAKPTVDYDTEYGRDSGPWTTTMFVEAVYKSLQASARPSAKKED